MSYRTDVYYMGMAMPEVRPLRCKISMPSSRSRESDRFLLPVWDGIYNKGIPILKLMIQALHNKLVIVIPFKRTI